MPLGLHGRPPLALQSGHHPEAQIDRCGQSASAENSSAKHSRKYRAHLYLSGLNRAHASVRVVADDRNSSRSRLTYVQAALADQQAVAPELLAALREADRMISRGLNRTYASARVVADDRNSSRSKLTYVLAALADRQAVALELLAALREADRTICRVFVAEHVTVKAIGAAVAKEKSPAASNPTFRKNQEHEGWSTQRFIKAIVKRVAAGGGCAPVRSTCDPQQFTKRSIKSHITTKGELCLFSTPQPRAAHGAPEQAAFRNKKNVREKNTGESAPRPAEAGCATMPQIISSTRRFSRGRRKTQP